MTDVGSFRPAIGPVGAMVLLSLCGEALGQINGSAHDFSSESWSGSEICLPCHTPHGADLSVVDAPLWNHRLSTASYSIYSSTTLIGAIGEPGALSRLCLSCHDGTVALDAFSRRSGSLSIASAAAVGTDLRDDHPVGVRWDHALANGSGCARCHDDPHGGQFKEGVRFFEGKVECASCHDVHRTGGLPRLLVKTMAGSALCQHCHDR